MVGNSFMFWLLIYYLLETNSAKANKKNQESETNETQEVY